MYQNKHQVYFNGNIGSYNFWPFERSHHHLYNLGTTRGWSQSATMWFRVISFSERQPLSAIVSSNSSRSIWSTFLTPASPSAANENTTGRPIWKWNITRFPNSNRIYMWIYTAWVVQERVARYVLEQANWVNVFFFISYMYKYLQIFPMHPEPMPWRHQFHAEPLHQDKQELCLVQL